MQKTILIPTGFSMISLKLLQTYLNKNELGQYTVIILQRAQLSDSITELLFYSKQRHISELCDKTYYEALNIIQSRFVQNLKKVNLDLFTGWAFSSFKNQLEALDVDCILLPTKDYLDSNKNLEGTDLFDYCFKADVQIYQIDLPVKNQESSKKQKPVKDAKLAELFF